MSIFCSSFSILISQPTFESFVRKVHSRILFCSVIRQNGSFLFSSKHDHWFQFIHDYLVTGNREKKRKSFFHLFRTHPIFEIDSCGCCLYHDTCFIPLTTWIRCPFQSRAGKYDSKLYPTWLDGTCIPFQPVTNSITLLRSWLVLVSRLSTLCGILFRDNGNVPKSKERCKTRTAIYFWRTTDSIILPVPKSSIQSNHDIF